MIEFVRRHGRGSLLVCLAALAVYAAVLAGFATQRVDPLTLVQDAADDVDHAIHDGLLSHVGVFGWVATAAITLFAAVATISAASGARPLAMLLLCGGTLSLLLGIDDFFLLHDRVIPQKIAYGTYAVLGMLIAGVFARPLLRSGGLGVLIAGGLLAASIAVDLVQHHLPGGYRAVQVVEEGLKFAGIACWLAAWCRVSLHAIGPDHEPVATPA